jgi:hypothetical protein
MWDSTSRRLKKGDGVAGTIPVLAQRAASEGWRGSGQVPFLLAERAHSESARSMRAVKGSLGHSLQERHKKSEGPSQGEWHVPACQWVGG